MAQTEIEKNIQEIVRQLKQEEKLLEEGRMISDYALKLPTLNGSEDKKTHLARKAEIIANFLKTNKTVQVMDIKDVNIKDGGITAIAEALEQNTILLDLLYTQFQYFIPETITTKITNYLTRNLQKQLGMEISEFRRTRLREIKHTNQIGFIDSIYRNRS